MKLGTQVRLPDGRIGTCVYNGLDGAGILWGLHDPNPADFEGTSGGIQDDTVPENWPWRPEAMLRDPWPGAAVPCVGSKFTILRWGLAETPGEPHD